MCLGSQEGRVLAVGRGVHPRPTSYHLIQLSLQPLHVEMLAHSLCSLTGHLTEAW